MFMFFQVENMGKHQRWKSPRSNEDTEKWRGDNLHVVILV